MRPPRSGTLRPPRMDDLETWRICGVLLPASARTLDFHHPEGWACCVRSSKGVRGGTPEVSFRDPWLHPERDVSSGFMQDHPSFQSDLFICNTLPGNNDSF